MSISAARGWGTVITTLSSKGMDAIGRTCAPMGSPMMTSSLVSLSGGSLSVLSSAGSSCSSTGGSTCSCGSRSGRGLAPGGVGGLGEGGLTGGVLGVNLGRNLGGVAPAIPLANRPATPVGGGVEPGRAGLVGRTGRGVRIPVDS